MRVRYPCHLNIGAVDSPEGSCELSVKFLSNGESNQILA